MTTNQWASLFLLNPRVLLVDDDKDFAEASAAILRKGGAEVMTVHDGNAALVAVNNFQPDLIISDLAMPVLRGDELLAQLRKAGYKKPFILLTGFAEMTHVAEALHHDAFDYLVKPIGPSVIVAACQKAFRSEYDRLVHEAELQELYAALAAQGEPKEGGTWHDLIHKRAQGRVRAQRAK